MGETLCPSALKAFWVLQALFAFSMYSSHETPSNQASNTLWQGYHSYIRYHEIAEWQKRQACQSKASRRISSCLRQENAMIVSKTWKTPCPMACCTQTLTPFPSSARLSAMSRHSSKRVPTPKDIHFWVELRNGAPVESFQLFPPLSGPTQSLSRVKYLSTKRSQGFCHQITCELLA